MFHYSIETSRWDQRAAHALFPIMGEDLHSHFSIHLMFCIKADVGFTRV